MTNKDGRICRFTGRSKYRGCSYCSLYMWDVREKKIPDEALRQDRIPKADCSSRFRAFVPGCHYL
ncbi:hypothetical protein KFK09_028929 [Dendrobium nobile]|uniref:Uncharacterized protein n=1 Tax=Dendrobium nobile TaxID=94219 RepID=A0A8T3A3U3_DENNO|nr:hypothetical protein KFK09_028929 [Dendrobium nobile]